jgi:hypothetical protein
MLSTKTSFLRRPRPLLRGLFTYAERRIAAEDKAVNPREQPWRRTVVFWGGVHGMPVPLLLSVEDPQGSPHLKFPAAR